MTKLEQGVCGVLEKYNARPGHEKVYVITQRPYDVIQKRHDVTKTNFEIRI